MSDAEDRGTTRRFVAPQAQAFYVVSSRTVYLVLPKEMGAGRFTVTQIATRKIDEVEAGQNSAPYDLVKQDLTEFSDMQYISITKVGMTGYCTESGKRELPSDNHVNTVGNIAHQASHIVGLFFDKDQAIQAFVKDDLKQADERWLAETAAVIAAFENHPEIIMAY